MSMEVYSRVIHYTDTSFSQIERLIAISTDCEQHFKMKCFKVKLFKSNGKIVAWWVSHDGSNRTYWNGANETNQGCACAVSNSCDSSSGLCNCNQNDDKWCEDVGLLTNKMHLPVTKLRLGDVGGRKEKANYTLGSLKCNGMN